MSFREIPLITCPTETFWHQTRFTQFVKLNLFLHGSHPNNLKIIRFDFRGCCNIYNRHTKASLRYPYLIKLYFTASLFDPRQNINRERLLPLKQSCRLPLWIPIGPSPMRHKKTGLTKVNPVSNSILSYVHKKQFILKTINKL